MSEARAKHWYFYLVRCCDNSLFAGVTADLEAQLKAHNAGDGAKYTRLKRPVNLAYWEGHRSRGSAMSRREAVNSWTRIRKERLALGDPLPEDVQRLQIGKVLMRRSGPVDTGEPGLAGLSPAERDRV